MSFVIRRRLITGPVAARGPRPDTESAQGAAQEEDRLASPRIERDRSPHQRGEADPPGGEAQAQVTRYSSAQGLRASHQRSEDEWGEQPGERGERRGRGGGGRGGRGPEGGRPPRGGGPPPPAAGPPPPP